MRRGGFDLAVVGAGFAGLACAEAAARRGLRVVVLERKRDVGAGVHTTGLLTREAATALRAPPSVLGARLDAIDLCVRQGSVVRLRRDGAGFLATDTPALLRALADRAVAAGAELRLGAAVDGLSEGRAAARLAMRDGDIVGASRVVACDGARSRIARAAGLARPRRMLAGVEQHVELAEGHDLDPGACLLMLDHALAPGYAAWCVRGVHGAWQVGVLGDPRAGWRPDSALRALLAWLARTRGGRVNGVVETRGGIVPAGGAPARPWNGRVIAVGDAAGHVSALTAGGIGRAALAGRAVGEGLLEPGEPWQPALEGLAAACGGWRRAAAAALALAVRCGAPGLVGALQVQSLATAATDLAFRETRVSRGPRAGTARSGLRA